MQLVNEIGLFYWTCYVDHTISVPLNLFDQDPL